MTRALSELLRDVAKALAGYASTRHAQACLHPNPYVAVELREEVAYIEALEREVREAAQAQVARDKAVLLLLDLAQEAWNQWAFRADDGSLWDGGLSTLERLEGILGPLGLLNHDQHPVPHPALSFDYADDETIVEVGRAALAQAQAGAGEGQGEGA
ncbi:hypothetical protein [Deinococcus kurensis]|uniref:hypothetical protein n=1 Tax=Deinococcus kurensis TaxID=2662757 RepID=UPI0012D2E151|nr:hypothetical protein [Deinococcus kurensis]